MALSIYHNYVGIFHAIPLLKKWYKLVTLKPRIMLHLIHNFSNLAHIHNLLHISSKLSKVYNRFLIQIRGHILQKNLDTLIIKSKILLLYFYTFHSIFYYGIIYLCIYLALNNSTCNTNMCQSHRNYLCCRFENLL